MIDAKEKTALATSVGADERQSFQTSSANIIPTSDTEINHPDENSSENLEEIYRQMQRMNDPAYLHTVSMNDLYETVFQSRPPVIDGLLYSGTYLFAGAPKVGKSFFMAQLAYHISTGQKLWDYDVHQGTVLYLALEDDYQRLQERMSRMFGVEGTDSLHFAVYAKQLGAGLDEQLEKFIRDHPDTRLIIIDTLQKIREVSTDAYSYANDYDIVGRMKQFADKNGVCLLLVHHTRKQQAGDKFEMISGTTGLLGCADGAFLLQKEKRTDLHATLEIVGRDQPDQKLHLTRDEEKLIWLLDHTETELWKQPPDPLLDKIAAVITDAKTHHKYPINDFSLIPDYAVLDASLTLGLPPQITATTGMDALTHAIESYIGRSTNKFTRAMAEDAVVRIVKYLRAAYDDGSSVEARRQLLRASYCAGVAFTRSYVGYVHGIAHSLGGQYGIAHGLANAVILPHMLRHYGASVTGKLAILARKASLVPPGTGEEEAAERLISWIEEMNHDFGIPKGIPQIREEDIPQMARHASRECNPLYPVPVLMNRQELEAIYHELMHKEEPR